MPEIETLPPLNPCPADIRGRFAQLVGSDNLCDDEASLRLFSEDIWAVGKEVAALIVAPGNTTELAAVVSAAHELGLPLAPRGGGMGYTESYTPVRPGTISLDTRRLNRVLAISPEDMTVTVEAGCTWLALNEALKPLGLRTPFWGPMSGIGSTIGGGLSQLNAMFGAGHHGTSSESVIALTMVLADGTLLKTGARGPDGETPFYRHYGPDLVGLFCGDSGTLGIKAEVTLRLIRAPAFEDCASFSFKSGPAMMQALAEIARGGHASETCGFDPGLTRVRMKRMSLAEDVKTLGKVIAKEGTIGKGLLAAAKIALGGRTFIEEDEFSLHVIAEGRCKEAVAFDMAAIREIAKRFEGVEVENTVAKVVRANPFPPANSILGPEGESWAPVHGHVSLSNAPKMLADILAYFDEMQPRFDALGIYTGFLFTSLSTNAVTIEPVFFWPRGYRPVHATMVEAAHLSRLPKLDSAPDATAVVTEARDKIKAICQHYGAAHFQIGRTYPYRQSREPGFLRLLDAIKAAVDPKGLFNPGGLGFPQ